MPEELGNLVSGEDVDLVIGIKLVLDPTCNEVNATFEYLTSLSRVC